MVGDPTVPFAFPLPRFAGVGVSIDRFHQSPHIALHFHPAYELVLVQRSSGRRLVGDVLHAYEHGDCVLVGPNLPHAWISADRGNDRGNPHATCSVALFTRESLGLELLARPELAAIDRLMSRARRGLAFPSDALAGIAAEFQQLSDASDAGGRLLRFLLLLHRLAAIAGAEPVVSSGYVMTRDEQDYRTLATILDHLRRNSQHAITLAEMARHCRVSVPTFTRFFRRMTGHSFIDYLNRWRIDQAGVQLRETSASILEISLRIGFPSLAHFNRQFRRWRGCAPREFRQREGRKADGSVTPAGVRSASRPVPCATSRPLRQ